MDIGEMCSLSARLLDIDAVQVTTQVPCSTRIYVLASIRDAILAVTDRKFWEITDRGFNFDFVEPEMRKYVHEFFDPMVDGL